MVGPPEPEDKLFLGLTFSDIYYYTNLAYWRVTLDTRTDACCGVAVAPAADDADPAAAPHPGADGSPPPAVARAAGRCCWCRC